jgi:deazaflavin-dependent oxidoreductase (nitroreductase family)
LKKTNPSSSSKASRLDREQFLYLTTRGRKSGLPREIQIWFTERDDCFYVIAEYATAQWLRNLQAHSEVEVRIREQRFRARARVLLDGEDRKLREAVEEGSRKKYGWGEGTVVELEPIISEG